MKCLITGGAGFIGSNLARYLLDRGDDVVIFDNFSNGKRENLEEIKGKTTIVEGDLRDPEAVFRAMAGVDAISHQGALGSVPRSVADPRTSHDVNVNGTVNVLEGMRKTGIKRIVFAGSSSAYGGHLVSPKHEGLPPAPRSPYAGSKVACEATIQGYAAVYALEPVILRYFNVFGPRQDPKGQYAAVIPLFINALLSGERPIIYGDGTQSRDFCYIENVCYANWLALHAESGRCDGSPVNIACGYSISLNDVLRLIQESLGLYIEPIFKPERLGDVKHSLASISAAMSKIGYTPKVLFKEGLKRVIQWHIEEKKDRKTV
jgi:nucleoside-diphosphate-sugar epimerase